MTETIFDDEDRSPETVEAAERRLRAAIKRRDAAWTVIEISRQGPNLPTDVYIMFKNIHGNAEGEIIEARRDFERAAMIYREVKRQEWRDANARKLQHNYSITECNALYALSDAADDRLEEIAETATEREWIDAKAEAAGIEQLWSDAATKWRKRMALRAKGRTPPKRRVRRTVLVDGVRTKIERETVR